MSAIKRSLNVGVAGLGAMGVPIARSIAFKSRSGVYLQLHSRSMAKASRVCDDIETDGAQCAMRLHNRLPTLNKWSDVVVTVQHDRAAARNILLEADDALLRNARRGQIFVDHTTVDVETSKECYSEAAKRGAYFLDAPMSGSPEAAFNGQLTVMVGGDEEAYNKVLPLLRLYGENIQHMGPDGSGTATKAIIQMLVAVHTVAAAEAMTMAHVHKVENHTKLLNAIDASWGSSVMLQSAKQMEKLLRHPERPPPPSHFTVDRLLSELALNEPGTASGLDRGALPLYSKATQVFARTSSAGAGDRDLSSVALFTDSLNDAEGMTYAVDSEDAPNEPPHPLGQPPQEFY